MKKILPVLLFVFVLFFLKFSIFSAYAQTLYQCSIQPDGSGCWKLVNYTDYGIECDADYEDENICWVQCSALENGCEETPAPGSCGVPEFLYSECDWGIHQLRDVYQDDCGSYSYQNYRTQPGSCGAPSTSVSPPGYPYPSPGISTLPSPTVSTAAPVPPRAYFTTGPVSGEVGHVLHYRAVATGTNLTQLDVLIAETGSNLSSAGSWTNLGSRICAGGFCDLDIDWVPDENDANKNFILIVNAYDNDSKCSGNPSKNNSEWGDCDQFGSGDSVYTAISPSASTILPVQPPIETPLQATISGPNSGNVGDLLTYFVSASGENLSQAGAWIAEGSSNLADASSWYELDSFDCYGQDYCSGYVYWVPDGADAGKSWIIEVNAFSDNGTQCSGNPSRNPSIWSDCGDIDYTNVYISELQITPVQPLPTGEPLQPPTAECEIGETSGACQVQTQNGLAYGDYTCVNSPSGPDVQCIPDDCANGGILPACQIQTPLPTVEPPFVTQQPVQAPQEPTCILGEVSGDCTSGPAFGKYTCIADINGNETVQCILKGCNNGGNIPDCTEPEVEAEGGVEFTIASVNPTPTDEPISAENPVPTITSLDTFINGQKVNLVSQSNVAPLTVTFVANVPVELGSDFACRWDIGSGFEDNSDCSLTRKFEAGNRIVSVYIVNNANQASDVKTVTFKVESPPVPTPVVQQQPVTSSTIVKEEVNCYARLTCAKDKDGTLTGYAAKTWYEEGLNSTGDCPAQERIYAPADCPLGEFQPAETSKFTGEKLTLERDKELLETRLENIVTAPQCEYKEYSDQYQCSKGERCFNRHYIDPAVQCKDIVTPSCVKDEQCLSGAQQECSSDNQCKANFFCEAGICKSENLRGAVPVIGGFIRLKELVIDENIIGDGISALGDGLGAIGRGIDSAEEALIKFAQTAQLPVGVDFSDGEFKLKVDIGFAIKTANTTGDLWNGYFNDQARIEEEKQARLNSTECKIWLEDHKSEYTFTSTRFPSDSPCSVADVSGDVLKAQALNTFQTGLADVNQRLPQGEADEEERKTALKKVLKDTLATFGIDLDNPRSIYTSDRLKQGIAKDEIEKVGCHLEKIDECSEVQLKTWFDILSKIDLGASRRAINLILPVDSVQNYGAAENTCKGVWGAGCVISTSKPGAYVELTGEEHAGQLEQLKNIIRTNFPVSKEVDFNLVAQYAASFGDQVADPLVLNDAARKAQRASLLGVTVAELDQIHESFVAYGKAGEYIRTQTVEGKVMGTYESIANLESLITAVATIDPSWIAGGIGVGKILLKDAAKSALIKELGYQAGKSTAELAERAMERLAQRQTIDTAMEIALREVVRVSNLEYKVVAEAVVEQSENSGSKLLQRLLSGSGLEGESLQRVTQVVDDVVESAGLVNAGGPEARAEFRSIIHELNFAYDEIEQSLRSYGVSEAEAKQILAKIVSSTETEAQDLIEQTISKYNLSVQAGENLDHIRIFYDQTAERIDDLTLKVTKGEIVDRGEAKTAQELVDALRRADAVEEPIIRYAGNVEYWRGALEGGDLGAQNELRTALNEAAGDAGRLLDGPGVVLPDAGRNRFIEGEGDILEQVRRLFAGNTDEVSIPCPVKISSSVLGISSNNPCFDVKDLEELVRILQSRGENSDVVEAVERIRKIQGRISYIPEGLLSQIPDEDGLRSLVKGLWDERIDAMREFRESIRGNINNAVSLDELKTMVLLKGGVEKDGVLHGAGDILYELERIENREITVVISGGAIDEAGLREVVEKLIVARERNPGGGVVENLDRLAASLNNKALPKSIDEAVDIDSLVNFLNESGASENLINAIKEIQGLDPYAIGIPRSKLEQISDLDLRERVVELWYARRADWPKRFSIKEIPEARNLDELTVILRTRVKLTDGQGIRYEAEDLIETIKEIIEGTKPQEAITTLGGLRDKVIELKAKPREGIAGIIQGVPLPEPLGNARSGILDAVDDFRPLGAKRTPEQVEQAFKKINKADNFDELYSILDERGGIRGSDGTLYSAQQLKEYIEAARQDERLLIFVTRTDDLKETVRRLRIQDPCILGLHLIPVAYAQGVPCPNPNVLERARSWLDGIFGRGEPEQAVNSPVIPLNFADQGAEDTLSVVKSINASDIQALDIVAKPVAGEANRADYVIVTGRSGKISRTLLEKQGINPERIIEFDDYLNGIVYKDPAQYPLIPSDLTEEQRNQIIRQALIDKGVPLDGSSKPTFLIVDDRVRSGGKAAEYLHRFDQIDGVGESRFAAFGSQFDVVISPDAFTIPEGMSRDEFEALSGRTFLPSGINTEESRRVYVILDNLSEAVSYSGDRDALIGSGISPRYFEDYQQAAANALEEIRTGKIRVDPCSTGLIPVAYAQGINPCPPQNILERAKTTVTGWFDNLFRRENQTPQIETPVGLIPDSTGTTFTKLASMDYLGGIEQEFNALQRLYGVAPENVAKPIELIKEGDNVIGYKVEYIEGLTAAEYIEKYGGFTEDIKNQIENTLKIFQKNILAHGDPNFGNIIITPEGRVKFIDPVGYLDFKPEYAQFDLDHLYLDRIKTISPCLVGLNIIPLIYAQSNNSNPCRNMPVLTGIQGLINTAFHRAERVIPEPDISGVPAEMVQPLRNFYDQLAHHPQTSKLTKDGDAIDLVIPMLFEARTYSINVRITRSVWDHGLVVEIAEFPQDIPFELLAGIFHGQTRFNKAGIQPESALIDQVENFLGINRPQNLIGKPSEELNPITRQVQPLAHAKFANPDLIEQLKSDQEVASLVVAGKYSEARELLKAKLRTGLKYINERELDYTIFGLANEIFNDHTLGRQVTKYVESHNLDEFLTLSNRASSEVSISPRKDIFSEGDIIEIKSRVSELTNTMKIPQADSIEDSAELIGILSMNLGDPNSLAGRDIRRMINIIYSSTSLSEGYFASALHNFFADGGKIEDLPHFFALLLAENKARFAEYRSDWQLVIDTYNNRILPIAERRYKPLGIQLGRVDPEDIVWYKPEEVGTSLLERCKGVPGGYCSTQTTLLDPEHGYVALNLQPSEYPNEAVLLQRVGVLTHENIHARVINQVGNTKDPYGFTSDFLEELTERLNKSIQLEFSGGSDLYIPSYVKQITAGDVILRHLSIGENEISRFAATQDPVGYIRYLDSKLSRLTDSEYRDFIVGLYQDVQIGPSQRDLLLNRRATSTIDIRGMSDVWLEKVFGPETRFGISDFEAVKNSLRGFKRSDPLNIFDNVDRFASYMESNRGLQQDPFYTPNYYFSETKVGLETIHFESPSRQLIPQSAVPPCPVGLNIIKPAYAATDPCPTPGFFEKINNSVSDFWNRVFGREEIVEAPLDWSRWRNPGFNVREELKHVNGPLVELAGPTDWGFELVNTNNLPKKLHISNVPEGFCSDAVPVGPVNFFADATKTPFQTGKVGAIFVSCLYKPLRVDALREANRVLENNGLLIWQSAVLQDIELAKNLSFEVAQYTRVFAEYDDPVIPDEYLYNIILRKTKVSN